MQTCTKCGETKKPEDFHRKGTGRQVWCKQCMALAHKRRWAKRKDAHYAKKQERMQALKEWVDALKAAPCTDCGSRFPPYSMHWDHLPGTKKARSEEVSNLVRRGCSRERILAEITKCDLVCGNCHSVRTHERRAVAHR